MVVIWSSNTAGVQQNRIDYLTVKRAVKLFLISERITWKPQIKFVESRVRFKLENSGTKLSKITPLSSMKVFNTFAAVVSNNIGLHAEDIFRVWNFNALKRRICCNNNRRASRVKHLIAILIVHRWWHSHKHRSNRKLKMELIQFDSTGKTNTT